MEFDSNRPIYLQILDAICDQILDGTLQPDGRIPSVRDYGAQLGVNPNTIMRSYEKLTNDGIIYNKRGLGYFISADAREKVLSIKRKEFMDDFFRKSATRWNFSVSGPRFSMTLK